jgi:hypothetical protein
LRSDSYVPGDEEVKRLRQTGVVVREHSTFNPGLVVDEGEGSEKDTYLDQAADFTGDTVSKPREETTATKIFASLQIS